MKVNLKWSQSLRGLVNRLWVTSVLSHWQHVLIASRKCERGYAWLAYLCCLNLSHLDENHITRARTQHDFSMSLAVSLSPVQLRAGGSVLQVEALQPGPLLLTQDESSSIPPLIWHTHRAGAALGAVARTQRAPRLSTAARDTQRVLLERKELLQSFLPRLPSCLFLWDSSKHTACQIAKTSSRKKRATQLLEGNFTRK